VGGVDTSEVAFVVGSNVPPKSDGTDVGASAAGVTVGTGTKGPPVSLLGVDVGTVEPGTTGVGDDIAGPTDDKGVGKEGLGVGAGVGFLTKELP
jgi:hypothetical protein